jgi:hypothetical protein
MILQDMHPQFALYSAILKLFAPLEATTALALVGDTSQVQVKLTPEEVFALRKPLECINAAYKKAGFIAGFIKLDEDSGKTQNPELYETRLEWLAGYIQGTLMPRMAGRGMPAHIAEMTALPGGDDERPALGERRRRLGGGGPLALPPGG